jgi:hypothetical protein
VGTRTTPGEAAGGGEGAAGAPAAEAATEAAAAAAAEAAAKAAAPNVRRHRTGLLLEFQFVKPALQSW